MFFKSQICSDEWSGNDTYQLFTFANSVAYYIAITL